MIMMMMFSPSRAEDSRTVILLNLEEHLGLIAGVICSVLGLLSLVLAILLCRRYSQVSQCWPLIGQCSKYSPLIGQYY